MVRICFFTTFGQPKVEQKLPAVAFFRLGALAAWQRIETLRLPADQTPMRCDPRRSLHHPEPS